MNSQFHILLFLFLGCSSNEVKVPLINHTIYKDNSGICDDFNSLNINIRDQIILKAKAADQIQMMLPLIKGNYFQNRGYIDLNSNCVFPVQGYDFSAIGGTNGSGYSSLGYDYFDGNKHGGHPAHDIFIRDKDQDCIDDKTKKPVNVLSMTSGIVIAMESEWESTSNLRGGKYIWIYDPNSNSLFYYAHNNSIVVKLCDIVKPGELIATVGRTGLNAFKKRSPTHLHIMQLHLDKNNIPYPINCYEALKKCGVK